MTDTPNLSSVRSLIDRATELKRLATDQASARQGADEYQQLKTRADELTALATRAKKLANALASLDASDGVASVAREDIPAVRAKVRKLQIRIQQSGVSVLLVKKALESLGVDEALSLLERRALAAWREYVQSGIDTGGLEAILSKYPGYRTAASAIMDTRSRLTDRAKTLPTNRAHVVEVQQLRNALGGAVNRAISDQGLSDGIVRFLGRAVAGVPLEDVLSDHELLSWLRDRDHAKAFKVLPA